MNRVQVVLLRGADARYAFRIDRRDPSDPGNGVVQLHDDAHAMGLRIRDAAAPVIATRTDDLIPRIVVAPIPRVAVGIDEAAAALGLSRDSFRRHVLPELRVVRVGARRLVRVAELERWAQRLEMVE